MDKLRHILAILLFSHLISYSAYSQVTIGSAKPSLEGAILELKEYESKPDGTTATKGLLLPRVELTSYTNLKDLGVMGAGVDLLPQTGILVYHVSEDNCNYIPHGVYTWTGEKWVSIRGDLPSITTTNKRGIDEPNSYIVNGAGLIQIPISKAYKIWNQSDFKDDYNEHLIDKIQLQDLTAKVIWMDNKGVICSLDFPPATEVNENTILEVQVGHIYGNAVVGIEWQGKIMWSWHIWSTPNVDEYVVNGHTWMDRNLGANSNTAGEAASRGMLYQWGRHTPFPNSSTATATEPNLYDVNGNPVAIRMIKSEDEKTKNLESAINYPLAYITNSTSAYYDWYSSTETMKWLKRWDKDGTKSPMDPCPEGWKVPSLESDGSSPWKGVSMQQANDFKDGWNWNNFGYYPLTGSRIGSSGFLSGKESGGHYWTATAPLGFPRAMYLSKTTVLDQAQSYMGEAFAVRCIKE